MSESKQNNAGLAVVAPARSATENQKKFGSCYVQTVVDDFTDERKPSIACNGESDGLGGRSAGTSCHARFSVTAFSAGIQLHFLDTIEVLHRFDKEKLFKGSWQWSKSAYISASFNKFDHDNFISGVERGRKLYIKVGNNKLVVDLTGGAHAVAEYKQRCAALGRM